MRVYIYISEIKNENIIFIKKIKCKNFPHGIDIYNNKLIYTSYANSSIIIEPLDKFI